MTKHERSVAMRALKTDGIPCVELSVAGGKGRARALSAERRKEIASMGGRARITARKEKRAKVA